MVLREVKMLQPVLILLFLFLSPSHWGEYAHPTMTQLMPVWLIAKQSYDGFGLKIVMQHALIWFCLYSFLSLFWW